MTIYIDHISVWRTRLVVAAFVIALILSFFFWYKTRTPPIIITAEPSTITPTKSELSPSGDHPSKQSNIVLPASTQTPIEKACGVKINEAESLLNRESVERAANASFINTRQDIVKNLLSSKNSKKMAAGLLLTITEPIKELATCKGEECTNFIKTHDQSSDLALAKLATLANETQSPTIYAWAKRACDLSVERPNSLTQCAALSAQRWAELSPESVWPWLSMASEAIRRNDFSGQENAIFRASLLSNWKDSSVDILNLLKENIPDQIQGLPRLMLLSGETSLVQAHMGGLIGLSTFCSAEQDSNRKQTCAQIATNLLSNAENLLELSSGIKIGERSGLTIDRLNAARIEYSSLNSAFPNFTLDTTDPIKYCADLPKRVNYFQNQAEKGELNALREQNRLYKQ